MLEIFALLSHQVFWIDLGEVMKNQLSEKRNRINNEVYD